MGRPRKIKTPSEMSRLWEKYKEYCDNQSVLTHEFSGARAEFVSAELRKKITYTVEGFCAWLGLVRSAFYQNYVNNEKFADVAQRIREECEVDVRSKFELGVIPTQLSALWMSKYGYSTKTDTNVEGSVPVVISGGEALED